MKTIYIVTIASTNLINNNTYTSRYIFYAGSRRIAIQKGEELFKKYHNSLVFKDPEIKAERFTENWLGDQILEVI